MTDEELITRLRAAYHELGGQKKDMEKIASALNDQGILTAQGKMWKAGNVWQHLHKHCPDVVAERTREKGTKKPSEEAKSLPKEEAKKEEPRESPAAAKELIPLPATRPIFKGGPREKQGSFRIRKDMHDRVMKKLKRDRVRTGGSISSLVEILLWMYIGAPEDLLEENPYA